MAAHSIGNLTFAVTDNGGYVTVASPDHGPEMIVHGGTLSDGQPVYATVNSLATVAAKWDVERMGLLNAAHRRPLSTADKKTLSSNVRRWENERIDKINARILRGDPTITADERNDAMEPEFRRAVNAVIDHQLAIRGRRE